MRFTTLLFLLCVFFVYAAGEDEMTASGHRTEMLTMSKDEENHGTLGGVDLKPFYMLEGFTVCFFCIRGGRG